MRARRVAAPLVVVGLAAGCGGGSPSAPSTPPTGLSSTVTQAIVGAALTQATGMLVGAVPGGSSGVITHVCPGGGSMTITFDVTTPAGPSGPMRTSSRMELTDCRSQIVTINGDPYLMMTAEHTFGPVAGDGSSSMTSTIRTTGGLRFDADGTQGRARYDCTQIVSMQFGGNGPPSLPSVSSSGTITWEQPIGTATARPCGP